MVVWRCEVQKTIVIWTVVIETSLGRFCVSHYILQQVFM